MKIFTRSSPLILHLAIISIIYPPTLTFAAQNTANISQVSTAKKMWNLKDVDIHTVINEIAKETDKNFVISPQVTGKVNFVSSYPLSKDELYQAFVALLEMNGFEAIPSGKVIKIVPEAYSKEEGSPVLNGKPHTGMSAAIARVKYISATDLAKALKQLVFHFGYIEAYETTNDIIIVDRKNNIDRLLALINRLDKPTASGIELVHLKFAQSSDIVGILSTLVQRKSGNNTGFNLAADDRSNDILIQGGTPEQHVQIKNLVAKLDVPLNRKSFGTDVIYLKYLRAEKVATILDGLIQNYTNDKSDKSPTKVATTTSSQSNEQDNNKQALVNYSSLMGQQNSNTNPTQNVSGSGSSQANFANIAPRKSSSGSLSPNVQWEESTNSVIVSAPPELMAKLKKVIAKLDIRRPQVLIEAIIAEVEADKAHELGVELNVGNQVKLLTRFRTTLPLSGIGTNDQVAVSNPLLPDAVGQGLSGTIIRGNKLRFLLRALESDSRSNILSTPNILTLDNEPAQIKVGQKISFSVGQIQNNPTGGNPFNFYNQQDVGLILTINPQITPNGAIKLIIEQELSNVLPGQVSAGGNPNLSERFLHTTVMANNGDILVLGGLIQNSWQDVTQKVPVLGDIPLFGTLFRSQEKQLTKQNLMVFLRPTILYDETDAVHIVGSKYENLRQTQILTEKNINLANNETTPVLPVMKDDVVLPAPFEDEIQS